MSFRKLQCHCFLVLAAAAAAAAVPFPASSPRAPVFWSLTANRGRAGLVFHEVVNKQRSIHYEAGDDLFVKLICVPTG